MLQSVISSIVEAEAAAASEIKAAQNSARDILLSAESEKENIKDNLSKEIKSKVRAIIADAESAADKKSAGIINSGISEAAAEVKAAASNVDKASKLILGRILAKYGNG